MHPEAYSPNSYLFNDTVIDDTKMNSQVAFQLSHIHIMEPQHPSPNPTSTCPHGNPQSSWYTSSELVRLLLDESITHSGISRAWMSQIPINSNLHGSFDSVLERASISTGCRSSLRPAAIAKCISAEEPDECRAEWLHLSDRYGRRSMPLPRPLAHLKCELNVQKPST